MADSQSTFEHLAGSRADAEESRNGLRHTVSLTLSKVADSLIDPKLVLTWLVGALGAPSSVSGLLVPIREAGALLPQIFLAGRVERMRFRKWAWVAGAAGQGIFAALIAVFALTLEGLAAGIAICAALAGLAISRAACSVSFKDILGKTVEKTRRGAITGFAGSAASVAGLAFAGLLIAGVAQNKGFLIAAIALAACLWVAAALTFRGLEEDASDTQEDQSAIDLTPLREDSTLRRFIVVRSLLLPTALAPPYIVMLASQSGQEALSALGFMLLASSAASFVASYAWGRLADQSSRRVLRLSALLGAAAMMLAVTLSWLGVAGQVWAMPVSLFVLMIAYQGVRQGRSTYLVDMAPEDQRSTYAALANTVIGLGLLLVGVLGGLAAIAGPVTSLCVFAAICAAAVLMAQALPEVEDTDQRD
ncbi:MFS transporter [Aliishimia ponticola]|uniref:MFS transporter n=1 Tax=Aliishimia ponticola TaxID=2499833 RepID=A0A4S4NCI3_9RHOB|nr:MFS transporter [Aliishimia ponticola]THH35768.1 MFS transporter [Aliishimia ponticola]